MREVLCVHLDFLEPFRDIHHHLPYDDLSVSEKRDVFLHRRPENPYGVVESNATRWVYGSQGTDVIEIPASDADRWCAATRELVETFEAQLVRRSAGGCGPRSGGGTRSARWSHRSARG